jgi:general secretion pathway protein G
MKTKNLRNHRLAHGAGFTLIEIMLVVGIITVLMGSAIFMLTGNLEFAKETRAGSDIKLLTMQTRVYEMKNGGVLPPAGEAQAKLKTAGFLDQAITDPWGTEYKMTIGGPKGFKWSSAGPDRQFGNADDVK